MNMATKQNLQALRSDIIRGLCFSIALLVLTIFTASFALLSIWNANQHEFEAGYATGLNDGLTCAKQLLESNATEAICGRDGIAMAHISVGTQEVRKMVAGAANL
jgi:hypothetical protein